MNLYYLSNISLKILSLYLCSTFKLIEIEKNKFVRIFKCY